MGEQRHIRFKQSDIARAAKGLQAAGIHQFQIQIDPKGNMTILTGDGPRDQIVGPNEWDEVFRK